MSFSFANPLWLLGIPVLLVCLAALWGHHRWRKAQPLRWRWLLYVGGFTCCLLALSRPQLGKNVSQRHTGGGQLFLAVDISRSMLAQDVQPSRLKFAKSAIQYLSPYFDSSQVSLFPFAADGYLQVPLTHDIDTILATLANLNPSMTTDQGTDLTQALDTLFSQIMKMEKESLDRGEDWPPTQVLLFSDGESHHPLRKDVLAKYYAKKIPIFTVGTATRDGGRIPLSFDHGLTTFQSGTYLRDKGGKVVESRLDEDRMQQIAQATGGLYFPARLSEMKQLGSRLQQKQTATAVTTEVQVEAEYFPILLTLALLLLFADFCLQRWDLAIRLLPLCFLLLGAASPDSVEDIQAHIQATQDNDERAVLTHNLGVAYQKKNDLERAAQAFQEAAYLSEDAALKKKTLFNLGNSFLQMQKLPEALEAYQNAYDVATKNKAFDQETNKKLSENMALAAKILEQAQPSSSGEGESKNDSQPQDPKGSKKNYQAEYFSDDRKQKIFDLLTNEEQQAIQRLQRSRDTKKPMAPEVNTW